MNSEPVLARCGPVPVSYPHFVLLLDLCASSNSESMMVLLLFLNPEPYSRKSKNVLPSLGKGGKSESPHSVPQVCLTWPTPFQPSSYPAPFCYIVFYLFFFLCATTHTPPPPPTFSFHIIRFYSFGHFSFLFSRFVLFVHPNNPPS